MTYYLKKIIESLPNEYSSRIIFLSNSKSGQKFKKDLHKNAALVVFDDYIGSGHQIKNFITNVVCKLYEQYYSNLDETYILSLYISENGESYLGSKLSDWNIISQPREKAFRRRGSVFGYEKSMRKIREFCHEYGEQFFIWDIDKEGQKKKTTISMGYKNSQELISFCYRTPNNTIPIIWSSANDWYPLFPRFANDIISEAKMYRKESAFLLHKTKLVFKTNHVLITGILEKDEKLSTYITQKDILLLCIMRLKKNGANLASICQKLDLRLFDYDELLKDGFNRGLFTIDGDFTEKGTIAYGEISSLKNKYDYDLYWKHNFENPNDIFYLPKKFNGRT